MQIETIVDLFNTGFVRHVGFFALLSFSLIYILLKKDLGLKEAAWVIFIFINIGGILYEVQQYKDDIIIDIIANNIGFAVGVVIILAGKTATRDRT